MLKLYFTPGASSMAPHIALHEVGAPFESHPISLARNEHRSPAYLAVNPEGKVPTLLVDGRALTEVAGILWYLARRYPAARLLPAGDIEAEAQVVSWMSFIASTVHPARARGLDVTAADAVGYLQGLEDGALGGIFSAQVVEHLQPSYLLRFLELAYHKLAPGGRLVLETLNPACWVAFFESFIRDVTHVWPLHPETLQYFLRVSGFSDVQIEFRSPVDPSARLMPLARPPAGADAALIDLVETLNENADKLNARLFTYQDYAAVGRR